MKRSLFVGLVALVAASIAPAGEPGKHLFILSGQSNMVGLSPKRAFTPRVRNEFPGHRREGREGRGTDSPVVQRLGIRGREAPGSNRRTPRSSAQLVALTLGGIFQRPPGSVAE